MSKRGRGEKSVKLLLTNSRTYGKMWRVLGRRTLVGFVLFYVVVSVLPPVPSLYQPLRASSSTRESLYRGTGSLLHRPASGGGICGPFFFYTGCVWWDPKPAISAETVSESLLTLPKVFQYVCVLLLVFLYQASGAP